MVFWGGVTDVIFSQDILDFNYRTYLKIHATAIIFNCEVLSKGKHGVEVLPLPSNTEVQSWMRMCGILIYLSKRGNLATSHLNLYLFDEDKQIWPGGILLTVLGVELPNK